MKRANLGNLRIKFFAYIQSTKQSIVRIGDLQRRLELTAMQEHNLLKRLAKSGLVLRLKRGIYLVPQKLPAGGYWQPNEYYLIAKYMEVLGGEYYIGGSIAIHHYHFTTQIPNQFNVYNTKLSGKKQVGQLKIQFIKISPNRMGGINKLPIPHHTITVNISNLARTLLDSVNDWSRYNTLPIAYDWINQYKNDLKIMKELIDLTSKFANKNTLRRIGYILDNSLSEKQLRPLTKKLRPFQDWVKLDPKGNYQGKTNKKWGIINNVDNDLRIT